MSALHGNLNLKLLEFELFKLNRDSPLPLNPSAFFALQNNVLEELSIKASKQKMYAIDNNYFGALFSMFRGLKRITLHSLEF
jgi:hypothetical protein